MRKALAGLLIGLSLGAAVPAVATDHRPRVPRCAEDELLVGRGDFQNGRWTRYACAHPDDITAETIENDYRNEVVWKTVRGSVVDHGRFWWQVACIQYGTERPRRGDRERACIDWREF